MTLFSPFAVSLDWVQQSLLIACAAWACALTVIGLIAWSWLRYAARADESMGRDAQPWQPSEFLGWDIEDAA